MFINKMEAKRYISLETIKLSFLYDLCPDFELFILSNFPYLKKKSFRLHGQKRLFFLIK